MTHQEIFLKLQQIYYKNDTIFYQNCYQEVAIIATNSSEIVVHFNRSHHIITVIRRPKVLFTKTQIYTQFFC